MSLKDSLKKISREISERYDFLRGDKGKIEDVHKQLKQWQPDGKGGKIARIAGIGGIDLAWFLFCLGKYTAKDLNTVFLDNQIIDKLKKQNQEIKIIHTDSDTTRFFETLKKKHPLVAARLRLWMVYGLFTFLSLGSIKVASNQKTNPKEQVQNETRNYFQSEPQNEFQNDAQNDFDDDAQKGNFAAYKERIEPITPWLISELIAAEGVKMNAEGLHIPYQDGNGVWTIGFGSTRLKDGSHVTEKTLPITNEEAYELARWHLEDHETFFSLYCYGAADESLRLRNTSEAFGLSSVVYNSGTKFIEKEEDRNHQKRFEELRKEYGKYGAAISDSVVKKIFEKYPMVNKASFGKAWIDSHDPQDMAVAIGLYMKDGGGMHWRRWLEAGLFTGDIDPKDLLECPIGGMYDFYLYMGGYKEYTPKPRDTEEDIKIKNKELKKTSLWEKTSKGWEPKKSTYTAFKQWLKNPKTRAKGTGIEGNVTRKKVKDFLPDYVLQECMSGKCELGARVTKMNREKVIEEKTYAIGFEDFYEMAIDKYKQGDYKGALNIFEKLVADNPNNALLHNDMALIYNKLGEYDNAIKHAQIIVREIGDKTQYGAAQYNAGVAYENLGNLDKALANYELAVSNGNNVAKSAVKRVKEKIDSQKSKKTAFYIGVQKLKNKSVVVNINDRDFSA